MDTEREQAKNRLIAQLVALFGEGSDQVRAAQVSVRSISDEDLRQQITWSRLALESRSRFAPAQSKTLQLLASRAGLNADVSDQDAAFVLRDSHGLEVAEDGLVEVDRLDDAKRALIGGLPIALYHHTASGLYAKIAEGGLLVGKQTNFFNTQAGVYLSTMTAGTPQIYARRAALVHGGEPACIRVRRHLDQITPDPDDADLDWAQGRQFITPSVPPSDLADPDLAAWVQEQRRKQRLHDLEQHPGWIGEANIESRGAW